mmetsp:Transcript_48602/g.128193  ORF Transcript_48602/g.128193 Transcript_48602/m.128193 type:complete len:206 (-) Transcript_48602:2547-3164(-)
MVVVIAAKAGREMPNRVQNTWIKSSVNCNSQRFCLCALISVRRAAAVDCNHHWPISPSCTRNSCTPAKMDMPVESGTGFDGSRTQDKRRHVPLVEPLSLMCQRLPMYSKTQWIRDTLASIGSLTWIVLASPRPSVQRRSQSVSRSPVRGPEMNSSSSGGTGTAVGALAEHAAVAGLWLIPGTEEASEHASSEHRVCSLGMSSSSC